MLTLLLTLALAQDPAPDPSEAAQGEQTAEVEEIDEATVIVYDELAVDLAREDLLEELDYAGFTMEIERDDGTIVRRHPDAWRGEVRIHDDGWVRHRRQPIQFRPGKDNALGRASCVLILPCLRIGGQTVSRRKLAHQKEGVLTLVDEEVDALSDRIADRETGDRVSTLPDQLEALWYEGAPLDGDVTLDSHADRRQAIATYWMSRTDTIWGDRVRLAVEGFIRAEVQNSEHPFTADEVAAINDARSGARALDLESPWSSVSEGLLP